MFRFCILETLVAFCAPGLLFAQAAPSFDDIEHQGLLTIDFGNVAEGATVDPEAFMVFNLAIAESPASLSGVSSFGDAAQLAISQTPINGLAPGESEDLSIVFDTAVSGTFEVSYVLSFASDQLPSEPDQLLAIAAFGTVISPADFDMDGNVDADDYVLWRSSFGDTGPDLAADGNNDGVVDGADYTVWRDNLEQLPSPALAPEPAAGIIAILAASALLPRRRVSWH